MVRSSVLRMFSVVIAAVLLTPAHSAAQSVSDRLTAHGFATEAVGQSDGLGVAGIGSDLTFNYRTAALQLRLGLTSADDVVVQLGHRRLGRSVLTDGADELFLDWGFYTRRLPGRVSFRAGRVPMPRGLFNEIRDIGTLLPFYRAPLSFYTEGIETMEGMTLLRSFDISAAWTLDVGGFYGAWDFVQVQPAATSDTGMGGMAMDEPTMLVTNTRARHAFGGQLWLSTPVQGLRVGFGGQRFAMDSEGLTGFFGMVHGEMDMNGMDPDGPMGPMGSTDPMESMDPMSNTDAMTDERVPGYIWQTSIEGAFDRLTLRGEYEVFALQVVKYYAGYGQAVFRLTNRFSVNAQAEFSRVHHSEGAMDMEFRFARDLAAALGFSVTPKVMLKAEGHTISGHAFDTWVDPTAPPADSKYFILSVSAVF